VETAGSTPRALWVLGHRVTMIEAGGRVAAIEVVTPPGVPGPPPHHHESADESFYVVEGRLGVLADDAWISLAPGECVNVAAGTVHSFRNDGTDEVRVITAFEPQGFEDFFLEYGVDVAGAGAFEQSVSASTIARVVEGCARFGMILAPEALPAVPAMDPAHP
jgi:mannose-6-phosphate isomerase-like protein (cupin superfamily)